MLSVEDVGWLKQASMNAKNINHLLNRVADNSRWLKLLVLLQNFSIAVSIKEETTIALTRNEMIKG